MIEATFPATRSALPTILDWIQSHIASPRQQLVAEEAVVNIIDYADSPSITLIYDGRLTLRDSGKYFDLLAAQSRLDPNAPLQDRHPGGMGIDLIKRFTSEIVYRREGEENILILTFS
jgi:anti-sigma regulatory factor (Ser/Thr protein kinase)